MALLATHQPEGGHLGPLGQVLSVPAQQLSPSTATSAEVREKLREAEPAETEEQMARLGLLMELLERRGIQYYQGEEDNELNELTTFLCIN